MQQKFLSWPEYVGIEIYKLLYLGYPVTLATIVDGNGATKIISIGVMVQETEDNVKW